MPGGTRNSSKKDEKNTEKQPTVEPDSPGSSEPNSGETSLTQQYQQPVIPIASLNDLISQLAIMIDKKLDKKLEQRFGRQNPLQSIEFPGPQDHKKSLNQEVEQKHTPDVIVKSKPLTADTVRFFQPDY